MAATGVGAGDLVLSLVVGTRFGLSLIWTVVLGALIKYYIVEGVGRWHLASGDTIFKGWQRLGGWASWYFLIYYFLWAFIVGAAVPAAAGLGLHALIPQLPVGAWAALSGLAGFLLVSVGHYKYFEYVMKLLVGVLFITVVGTASLVVATTGGDLLSAFETPSGEQTLYILGVVGGVGGTLSLASYGYWLREKSWEGPSWLRIMRTDAIIGFTLTGIFAAAVMVLGAAFLFGSGILLQEEEGLVRLAELMEARLGLGSIPEYLFLIGFWAAPFTSFLGSMQGVSYVFADFIESRKTANHRDVSVAHPAYRFSILWFTFPPMLLHLFDTPVLLTIVYTIVGAFFMPFIAGSLLYLLNTSHVEQPYRNGVRPNCVLGLALILFTILCVYEIVSLF